MSFLEKTIEELKQNRLVIDGEPVSLSEERQFEYKAKFKADKHGGKVTFRIRWNTEFNERDELKESFTEED